MVLGELGQYKNMQWGLFIYMSHLMTKPTVWLCAQRRLRSAWASAQLIRVFAVRMKKAWVLSYLLSTSKDSDQTGRMPRLIWVFAGRTVILLVLSWGTSCCLRNLVQLHEKYFYYTAAAILHWLIAIVMSFWWKRTFCWLNIACYMFLEQKLVCTISSCNIPELFK